MVDDVPGATTFVLFLAGAAGVAFGVAAVVLAVTMAVPVIGPAFALGFFTAVSIGCLGWAWYRIHNPEPLFELIEESIEGDEL